jgi:hypothetical protein
MEIKFNECPLRKPIIKEPYIKVTIEFVISKYDIHKYKSVKVPESKLNSKEFRNFIAYAYTCIACQSLTETGEEGYEHIKYSHLYFPGVSINDQCKERKLNDIRMNCPNSSFAIAMEEPLKYKFSKISFEYYDEYDNFYPIELTLDNRMKDKIRVLSDNARTTYNRKYQGKHGFMGFQF